MGELIQAGKVRGPDACAQMAAAACAQLLDVADAMALAE